MRSIYTEVQYCIINGAISTNLYVVSNLVNVPSPLASYVAGW